MSTSTGDRFSYLAECVDCGRIYRFATLDARFGWLHEHSGSHDIELYQEERR